MDIQALIELMRLINDLNYFQLFVRMVFHLIYITFELFYRVVIFVELQLNRVFYYKIRIELDQQD